MNLMPPAGGGPGSKSKDQVFAEVGGSPESGPITTCGETGRTVPTIWAILYLPLKNDFGPVPDWYHPIIECRAQTTRHCSAAATRVARCMQAQRSNVVAGLDPAIDPERSNAALDCGRFDNPDHEETRWHRHPSFDCIPTMAC